MTKRKKGNKEIIAEVLAEWEKDKVYHGLDRGVDDVIDAVQDVLALAWRANRLRDRIDRGQGFAAPPDLASPDCLRTAIAALIAGLTHLHRENVVRGVQCLAEGCAMVMKL